MTSRLSHIELDLGDAPLPSPEMQQEQAVAIYDLVEENSFALPEGPDGPFVLSLGREGGKLSFDLTADGAAAAQFTLALGPVKQVVKDYGAICETYYEAVKTAKASEIEALDDARREIHREGAKELMARLDGKAVVDLDTARRLFTLVCVLLSED